MSELNPKRPFDHLTDEEQQNIFRIIQELMAHAEETQRMIDGFKDPE